MTAIIWDLSSARLTGPNIKNEYEFCFADQIKDEKPKVGCNKNIPADQDIWVEVEKDGIIYKAWFRHGVKK